MKDAENKRELGGLQQSRKPTVLQTDIKEQKVQDLEKKKQANLFNCEFTCTCLEKINSLKMFVRHPESLAELIGHGLILYDASL